MNCAGLFNRAIGLETSETCFFHFAKYLDQLMQGAKQRQEGKANPVKGMDRIGGKSRWVASPAQVHSRLRSCSVESQGATRSECRIQLGKDQPFVAYVAQVIKNYGKAVGCGNRHIYQSLPRLLTVWFEFGTYAVGLTPKTQTSQVRWLTNAGVHAIRAVPGLRERRAADLPAGQGGSEGGSQRDAFSLQEPALVRVAGGAATADQPNLPPTPAHRGHD